MDNQHKLIKNYKDLDQTTIDLINKVKGMGEEINQLVLEIDKHISPALNIKTAPGDPLYWLCEGKREAQKAMMFLVRAIAQPPGF